MNNYHFYQEQGKGKYSVIFKARKKKKLDFVAIKRMEKTRKNKILNQARILSQTNHPNIIKFYEYIESKNHMWAVTEYCPGGDLLKLIQQDKTLPQNIVRGFMIDILKGLQYCHSKGVIVCDVKPASILINEYGCAKIGDFGSARNIVDLMQSEKQSKKGTPSYMAPQLFVRGGVYSMQSDLWAIGCIMYELIQGYPPFVSTSYQEIANLATNAKTPIIQECSSNFNNLLESLLMKDPEKRIQWESLCSHPWLGGELKQIDMPEQPHFKQYLSNKQKRNNNNFLRASQQVSKDTYATSAMNANDRRKQFIFENDQGNLTDPYEFNNDKQDKIFIQQEQLKSTAFIKKKQKADGRVEKQKQVKDRDKDKSAIQDSSNINLLMQLISRKNLVPMAQLLNHNSDTAVKPIIGNKDIQVIESFNFNKSSLGFQYIEPQVLAQGIVNGEMEQQLKNILDGMVGDEKYHVMGYFQSIIQNSDIANFLFKQNFIKFYMKLMKGYKQAALRAKMFQIMGFLVRHATVIQPGVIKQGIINAFVQGVTKDKSQKVRRKAMAALGQLLFYGATQVDEGVTEWDISLNLIHTLQKILKNFQQDQIVRIYCCKSIENITAQAKDVGTKFAQVDTLMTLLTCFNTNKNQGFRTSICCAFHHIIQLNSSLRETLLQKMGVNNLIQAMKSKDLSSKSLQILLWVLLSQFMKSKTAKISKMYLQDQNLFRAILHKLDKTTSSTAKGRIYLYIYFYLQTEPKKCMILLQNNNNIISTNSNKLFNILQKHNSSDEKQNKYEVQCLQYLLVWLYENYQNIVKYVQQDIKSIVQKIESGYEMMNVKKSIGYTGIIWHMINCTLFQELFANQSNLDMLINILTILDSVPKKSYKLAEEEGTYANTLQLVKSSYMQVLQKLFSNSNISEKLQEFYSSKVLPLLVGRILKSQHQDIKFNCLKFLLYLITFYLNQQCLYDSTILSATSSKVSSVLLNHFIPQIDGLLVRTHNQAVSTMTIKLLVLLLGINPNFVRKFNELNKIEVILKYGYLQQGITANTLKLVHKCLAVSQVIGNPIQSDKNWLPQIFMQNYKILVQSLSTGQEILLDSSLQIFKELIRINGSNWKQQEIENVWQKVLPLQAHQDLVIRERAESVITAILQSGRFGSKGKWEVKEKKGVENYEKYLQITGKQKDPKVVQGMNLSKMGNSRYT